MELEAQELLGAAKEEEEGAVQDLEEAVALSSKVAGDAAEKTRQKIAEQIRPLAEQVAKARARAQGWDQPDTLDRALGAKAAQPYQLQGAVADQRVSEYEQRAQNLMAQAEGRRKEGEELGTSLKTTKSPVEVMEATHKVQSVYKVIGVRQVGIQKYSPEHKVDSATEFNRCHGGRLVSIETFVTVHVW